MTREKMLFTSESVTEGHPDKIADQISDAILDEAIKQDPNSRVALETIVNTGLVLLFGEMTTKAQLDFQEIVRQKVAEIGYTRGKFGFDAENLCVITTIDKQSPDIAQGVDTDYRSRKENEKIEEQSERTFELGAGDQGLMFGYACNETEQYMPLPITLAHRLTERLAKMRHTETVPYLRPDGKSQVTVEYDENGQPTRVDTIVVSTQHAAEISLEQVEKDVMEYIIEPVIPSELLDDKTKYFINPTGRFVIGGPKGDAGLTGRKIIVDTYGGMARHGGGAFSGKDATKVDRSASYMARYIAKNVVASGLADRIEVQLAYAIGVAEPVSINVNTFDTGKISAALLLKAIRHIFALSPSGIIDMLDLRRPIYGRTATYGHFGRLTTNGFFPWERTDQVEALKTYVAELEQ